MFQKSSIINEKMSITSNSVRISNPPKQGLLRNLINDKKSHKLSQAATISGSKAPVNFTTSELQLNFITHDTNFLNSSSTFNAGSTICVKDHNKESMNTKPKLSNTKRKRGSLFNLFSFQKPSVDNKKNNNKINDENEMHDDKLISNLPPPPPEFADINQSHRKNSYSYKTGSNEGSVKQHRSIFNALRRKPVVKSLSVGNEINTQEIDDLVNSNTSSPLVKEFNNVDICDAETTITKLFSFDNYITSNNDDTIEELNENVINNNEKLNYANEYAVEDESCELKDIIIVKEKIKKNVRTKQQVNIKIATYLHATHMENFH